MLSKVLIPACLAGVCFGIDLTSQVSVDSEGNETVTTLNWRKGEHCPYIWHSHTELPDYFGWCWRYQEDWDYKNNRAIKVPCMSWEIEKNFFFDKDKCFYDQTEGGKRCEQKFTSFKVDTRIDTFKQRGKYDWGHVPCHYNADGICRF